MCAHSFRGVSSILVHNASAYFLVVIVERETETERVRERERNITLLDITVVTCISQVLWGLFLIIISSNL